MINNDVLRSLRYTLNLSDPDFLALIHLKQPELSLDELKSYLANEEQGSFKRCTDATLHNALDSLIIEKRGPSPQSMAPANLRLTNNQILKKLRIAFSLQEAEMLEILASVDFELSKHELSALFRNPEHSNYRSCGDQLLRSFLIGLARRYRPAL